MREVDFTVPNITSWCILEAEMSFKTQPMQRSNLKHLRFCCDVSYGWICWVCVI